jgi:hypothetical protein
MPVLGCDVDPFGTDTLLVRFRIQLVFFCLGNQVFFFVEGGPINAM